VYNAIARRHLPLVWVEDDTLPPLDQIRLSHLQTFGGVQLLRLPNFGRRSLRSLALVMSRYGWDLDFNPVLSPRSEKTVRDNLATAWHQVANDKALLSAFLAKDDWVAVANSQGLSQNAARLHLLGLAERPPLLDPPPTH